MVAFQGISQENLCAHFPVPTSHQILYSTVPRELLTVVTAKGFPCASHEGIKETGYSSTLP